MRRRLAGRRLRSAGAARHETGAAVVGGATAAAATGAAGRQCGVGCEMVVRPTKPPADAHDTAGGGAAPLRLGATRLVIGMSRWRVCAVGARGDASLCLCLWCDCCEGVGKCRVSQSQCRGCVCAPCAIMVVNNLVTRKNCIQTSWCFPYFSLYPKRAVLELYALQRTTRVSGW